MGGVAAFRIARSQTPAVRSITPKPLRVLQAIGAVDQNVRAVLFKIVGISVAKPAWIEAEERIVGEEDRPALGGVGPERKHDAVVGPAIRERRAFCKSIVVDGRVN